MSPENIYSRTFKGLDLGVWVMLLLCTVLSLGLLSFFVINRGKCIPFAIKVTANTDTVYYTGQTINFDVSISSKKMRWDFGDGSDTENGLFRTHVFYKPGKYTVRASMNNTCEETAEIKVLTDPNDIRGTDKIIGPEITIPNKEEEYICAVYSPQSKWLVVGHPDIKPVIKGLSAKFRFNRPDTYIIQVTLDDNRVRTYSKEVVVKGTTPTTQPTERKVDIKKLLPDPSPNPDPKPVVVTAPTEIKMVPESAFKGFLKAIMFDESGKKSLTDFDQFLYYKGETKVRLSTGENYSFAAFYSKLPGLQDKITIDRVEFVKSAPDKIQLIRVFVTKQ